MRRTLLASLSFAVACSSSSFDLGAPTDDAGDDASADTAADTAKPVDTGGPDTTLPDTAASDTGKPPGDGGPDTTVVDLGSDITVGDGIVTDGIVPDDAISVDATPVDGGCPTLSSGATDVYVASGGKGTGTATCPFGSIQAALAVPWTSGTGAIRTIHVAGGTPTVHYSESGALVIKQDIILKGDGPTKTRVLASGDCGSTTLQCAIWLFPGGRVEGFSISPASPGTSNQNGVLLAAGGSAGKMPTLVDSEIVGANSNGVIAQGPGVLGPGVRTLSNKSNGVAAYSSSPGTLRIASDATNPNAFEGNSFTGVSVGGALNLIFDGGGAASNGSQGVYLWSSGGAHRVTGLVAKDNKGPGLLVGAGNSLVVRSSTFTGNTIGLSYTHGAGTETLDLGTGTAPGANQFGGISSTSRNTKAGVFVCESDSPTTQPAEGNYWSSCAPVQTLLTVCDVGSTPYADIMFKNRASGSAALSVTSCFKGP